MATRSIATMACSLRTQLSRLCCLITSKPQLFAVVSGVFIRGLLRIVGPPSMIISSLIPFRSVVWFMYWLRFKWCALMGPQRSLLVVVTSLYSYSLLTSSYNWTTSSHQQRFFIIGMMSTTSRCPMCFDRKLAFLLLYSNSLLDHRTTNDADWWEHHLPPILSTQ